MKIKKEIEQAMTGLENTDSAIKSVFFFGEEFLGFQGHFPGKKILPGVCQIQCALSTIEGAKGKRVKLKEVALAKYFSPVLPGDEVTCVCSDVPDAGEFTFKSVMSKGTAKVSEFKLRVVLTDR